LTLTKTGFCFIFTGQKSSKLLGSSRKRRNQILNLFWRTTNNKIWKICLKVDRAGAQNKEDEANSISKIYYLVNFDDKGHSQWIFFDCVRKLRPLVTFDWCQINQTGVTWVDLGTHSGGKSLRQQQHRRVRIASF